MLFKYEFILLYDVTKRKRIDLEKQLYEKEKKNSGDLI